MTTRTDRSAAAPQATWSTDEALAAFDLERVLAHVRWLTEHTPNRISGGGQDRRAAEYIVEQLASYGLDAGLQEFDTYTSGIGAGRLEVLGAEPWTPRVRACLHVEETLPAGFEAELVPVGPGGEDDYAGLDVRGKIVLAEVSYSPATPEKARLAHEHGAAGMILMNWGRADQDFIPWRALKAVWGNPTRSTWKEIPRLHALAVTRRDGERLKEACRRGPVRVRMQVTGSRSWARVAQPVAWLRAPEKSLERRQFVVVSGHLDAWEPGVTDNATGNAVMLELARVLAERRGELRRSVVFCFWNGHEIAEAAGSTYFVDTHWEELHRHGVAYLNIDSVGMRGATRFVINSSPELRGAHLAVTRRLRQEAESRRLQRIGDQSFFGVGVPALAARHGFAEELIAEWNGATLGWWNHTEQDTHERLDEAVLARDARFWTAFVHDLLTTADLPHRAGHLVRDLAERFEGMVAAGEDPAELRRVLPLLEELGADADRLDAFRPADERETALRNAALLAVSRHLTSLLATAVGRYGQDSYGLTDLAQPVPMLAPLVRYRALPEGDEERFLLATELLRVRHRFTDGIAAARAAIAAFELKVRCGSPGDGGAA